jgi:hypothetical protein
MRNFRAEIRETNNIKYLKDIALDIKGAFDKQSEERAFLLSLLNSKMEYLRLPAPKWHKAPDGSDCCCTAEDRQYGLGCR